MLINHTTIFSTLEFVESWCRAVPGCEPFAVQVEGSGPLRTMHVVRKPQRYGIYDISGPHSHDLWTSPGWTGELSRHTVQHILDQLTGLRTRSLEWQVRFDHEPLAFLLSSLGLVHNRVPVAILDLDSEHERIFARYSAIARKCVRRAIRKGVVIRDTCDVQDILEFEAIYTRLAHEKKWNFFFPTQLIVGLLKIPEIASFKVVQHGDVIVGGALFIRDGNSVYDLIGIGDRNYKDLYPVHAVTDAGIRWACGIGAHFFNFGNWGTNETLGEFKSFWGTRVQENWRFRWDNPIWRRARKVKLAARAVKSSLMPTSKSRELPGASSNKQIYGSTWPEKARMGELRAVLDPNATEVRNTILHGASLVGAEKALSLMRQRGVHRPTVLDFGCGTGRMVRFLADRDCCVVGSDITFEMLKAAKRFGVPKHCILALFNGLSLPLKEQSIDIVWVCGVLKYTLFPPGSLCVHGNYQSNVSPKRRFIPTCAAVAKEMYRVLKPGGVVANYEMWINESPDLFRPDFEQAGFITEQVKLLKINYDFLDRFYEKRGSRFIPPLFASKMLANYRYHFDDPQRPGFRDYFIIWRKPLESDHLMKGTGSRVSKEQDNPREMRKLQP